VLAADEALGIEHGKHRGKLFEWPLCGVAERKRRCSKRGVISRMPRVNWESIA